VRNLSTPGFIFAGIVVKFHPMKIKGIIFDFDGLLVDTETPQMRAWQKIYAANGATLHLQEWVRCLGTSADAFDPIADLRSKTAHPLDAQALIQHQRELVNRDLLHEPLRPGIRELLLEARSENLSLAIASSSNRTWVHDGLQRSAILDYFPVVCTSEDVRMVKPHPELYQLALRRMGLPGDEVVVLEDSPNGIRAAKAAGLFCAAYPNEISQHLDLTQADVILPVLDWIEFFDLLRSGLISNRQAK
jgi:putative hydrolase of the HAD superfamily